jgi:hypothetical protein
VSQESKPKRGNLYGLLQYFYSHVFCMNNKTREKRELGVGVTMEGNSGACWR